MFFSGRFHNFFAPTGRRFVATLDSPLLNANAFALDSRRRLRRSVSRVAACQGPRVNRSATRGEGRRTLLPSALSVLPRRRDKGVAALFDPGESESMCRVWRFLCPAPTCPVFIPSPAPYSASWCGATGDIEGYIFHGFRVGGLRRAAAPPVATVLGTFGAVRVERLAR
jgi:hypothetical protein